MGLVPKFSFSKANRQLINGMIPVAIPLIRLDNYWVNKLILILILAVHTFAFAGRASAFSTEFVAKFEITHSHHHDHNDEHKHDHDDSELDAKNVHPNLPTEEHTHRHEIVVSSQIPFILSSNCTPFLRMDKLASYPKLNQEPPQGPFLHGIFRPPIRA